MSKGHIAGGDMQIRVARADTWGCIDAWTQAMAEGLFYVCGPAVTRVCVEVCDVFLPFGG